MASEEIAWDKTGKGKTSKKCLLPINPISAAVISQRLMISGEQCYISSRIAFPTPLGPANISYCWDDGLLCQVYPAHSHYSPFSPVPSRSREVLPLFVVSVSIWISIPSPLEDKRNSNRIGEAACAQINFRLAHQFFT